MDKKKLGKIRRELRDIAKQPHGRASSELEGLAHRLGRKKEDRGKEPTWTRKLDPALSPPLSIPHHSTDLSVGVCKSVVSALLDDCDDWEQHLNSLEQNEAEDEQQDNDE